MKSPCNQYTTQCTWKHIICMHTRPMQPGSTKSSILNYCKMTHSPQGPATQINANIHEKHQLKCTADLYRATTATVCCSSTQNTVALPAISGAPPYSDEALSYLSGGFLGGGGLLLLLLFLFFIFVFWGGCVCLFVKHSVGNCWSV